MQLPPDLPPTNPLAGLISDAAYRVLERHSLLSERAIRDYAMRRSFWQMRREGLPATEAIERLRQAYPYLQYDTIRKIVYNTGTQSPSRAADRP